jgi:hypothetical protein
MLVAALEFTELKIVFEVLAAGRRLVDRLKQVIDFNKIHRFHFSFSHCKMI